MTDQMDDAAYAEYLDRAEDAASDEYWLAGIRESRRREARLAASEKREAALGSVCLAMIYGKTPNDEIIRRLRAESVPLSSAEALHDAVQPILSGDLKPSEYRGIGQTIVAYSVPASCIGAILAADYKYRALGGE